MSRRRSIPIVWRDAIGDSPLDSTAKLVAYQLTRWMNGRGGCYPSRDEIAAKASLSVRATEKAIRRLEGAGWLRVERSRGRRSHRYCAALPPTANEIRRSEWPTANERASNGEPGSPNGERRSPEGVKGAESGAPTAAASLAGLASSAHEPENWDPEDDCWGCGVRATLVGPDHRRCADCQAALDAMAAEGAK